MVKKKNKRSDIINLFLGLVILILLNIASQYLFGRFDLTAEKRYTLASTTKDMLKNLDDGVYFKVYLEGDFPQGAGDFKRLRDETRTMLDEFRAYGGDNIEYEFIDPNENPDASQRASFQAQLESKGLESRDQQFTDENGGESVMKLFPWAIATYHGKEVKIPLLGTNAAKPNEQELNHAVEGLEYELTNAIRKLQMKMKPKVAITQGHGEADSLQLLDLVKGMREYYDVEFVELHNNLNALRDTMQAADQIVNRYSAVVIVSPDSVFTAQELFILDQFVMYGGKMLLCVDPVYTSMDSLALTGMTIGLPRKLGLEDLTFRYGARMNSTLVEDFYCGDVVFPMKGGKFMKAPWYFSPTILPLEDHAITRHLDQIKFDFLSTIDTVETSTPVKKSILLKTSGKSRFLRTPTRIGLRLATVPRDEHSFDKPNQSVAVLLEGNFDSYYKNKYLPDELKKSKLIGYKERSQRPSKVIVIGDGDVAINPVSRSGKTKELGYDLINQMNTVKYANKTFLINCMNYLFDDNGLLSLRSRVVTLRQMDRVKIKEHRLKWQLINTIGPIFFVLIFGLIRMWKRKQKYVKDRSFALLDFIGVFALVLAILLLTFSTAVWIAFLTAAIFVGAYGAARYLLSKRLK